VRVDIFQEGKPLPLITLITALFFFAVQSQPVPVGTVIPVMVSAGLNAEKNKADKTFTGRVMQDVPLPDGQKIKEGAKIHGHIVKVQKPGRSGSVIALRFDEIEDAKDTIPITTSLLALAAFAEVSSAQSPISPTSDIGSPSQWVTRQVGGDVVNRGRGKVGSAKNGIVGKWLQGTAVMVKITPNPEAGCPAGPGYDRDQATWIFSSNACGVYGFNNLKMQNSGNSPPLGDITLTSSKNVEVRGGSGWLLMVVAAPSPN
jgi:hypothetical protein